MSNDKQLDILEILTTAEHNRVTYYPAFAHCLGNDVGAALFASNFLFWRNKQQDPDGWIYKDRDEITRETGMNRKMQEGARKRLIEYGILEEEKRGLPRRLYYKWDWPVFASLVNAHFKELASGTEPAPVKEPIMEAMRRIFDDFYQHQTDGIEFNWGSTSERGKQYGNLKKLRDVLAERICSRKTRDAAKRNNGMLPAAFDGTATYEELLVSWQAFLDNLPLHFRTKRLSPHYLYSDFSTIIAEVTSNGQRQSSSRSAGADIAEAI